MSISLAPSVEKEPYIGLSRWMLLEDAQELRYFVGRCVETGQSRISSAIRYFDSTKLRGTTFSGRVYALVGEPGIDAEIRRVLDRWLSINHISHWKDVSGELVTLMTATSTLTQKIVEGRKRRLGDSTLPGRDAVSVARR